MSICVWYGTRPEWRRRIASLIGLVASNRNNSNKTDGGAFYVATGRTTPAGAARLFRQSVSQSVRLAAIQSGAISLSLCTSVIGDTKIMRLLAEHRTQPPVIPARPSVRRPVPARPATSRVSRPADQLTASCAPDVRQTNNASLRQESASRRHKQDQAQTTQHLITRNHSFLSNTKPADTSPHPIICSTIFHRQSRQTPICHVSYYSPSPTFSICGCARSSVSEMQWLVSKFTSRHENGSN